MGQNTNTKKETLAIFEYYPPGIAYEVECLIRFNKRYIVGFQKEYPKGEARSGKRIQKFRNEVKNIPLKMMRGLKTISSISGMKRLVLSHIRLKGRVYR